MTQLRLTTRSAATAQAIADRKTFTTSGSLCGYSVDRLSEWDRGKLDGGDLNVFLDSMQFISYVVMSYATPIAWFSTEYGWHVVTQKFSLTTTKHQSNLYMIGR